MSMLINEYVIDLYDFQKDANPFEKNSIITNPDKNVSKERAKEMAKPSCKVCWGKGWILHEYLPYYIRTQFCDCITNKLEKAAERQELKDEYIKDDKLDIFENGYRVSDKVVTKWGTKFIARIKREE